MANTETQIQKTNQIPLVVLMVPLPAQGHLNQLLHLSRRIASHNIPVHFAASETHNRQALTRAHGFDPSSIPNLHFHNFPTPDFENPNPNPNAAIQFPMQILPSFLATANLRRPVFELAEKLSSTCRKIVIIYDSVMTHVVQDIYSVPNAESYCFQSISAFSLYSYIWEASGKSALSPEAQIFKDVPSTEGSFPDELKAFLEMLANTRKFNTGDIYNTSRLIEGFYVDLIGKEKKTGTDECWALGPFNPVLEKFEKKQSDDKILEWLDKQGIDNSVIFVSFGTTSSICDEQIFEIAFGLEKSEQRFVWVLRDADKGNVFEGDVRRAPLPDGFELRVKERGLIVRDWAPQLEILGHPSVGGFISHCGWNSCMESISMGVPIIAWPMHSDQPKNAFLMTEVLKMGIQIKDWARHNEIISSDEVDKCVRRLMALEEGDEIRKKANKLGDAVRESLMEGGVTTKEMDSFIARISRLTPS